MDVGCGTGQAVEGLSHHFSRVIGVDPSPSQIECATAFPNATYAVAGAESFATVDALKSLEKQVDCVTVAQAIHWFDMPSFLQQVDRVLKDGDGSRLSFWTYPLCTITSHPSIDAELKRFDAKLMAEGYWPPQRKSVDCLYADIIASNFSSPTSAWMMDPEVVQPLVFPVESKGMPLESLYHYLGTWSAVKNYKERHGGEDPVVHFAARVEACIAGECNGDVSSPSATAFDIQYDMTVFLVKRRTAAVAL